MLVYLGICAVGAFLAALISFHGAVSPAPTLHLFFAAGAMPLIFGAIIHFVPVLTRSGTPAPAIRFLPVVVQAAGIITPLGLAGMLPPWSLHAAASLVSVTALILLVWIGRRMRATLGTPHPGARWYGAALLCLFLAVSLVPVWLALPQLRPLLRLFHLHLNTLGFIGLAALGTLPVLLPTALGRPDGSAGGRLRSDLPLAAGGAAMVAAGAAAAPNQPPGFWLALAGALCLAWVAARDLAAWGRTFGWRALLHDGAAAPLAGATAGFLLLLLLGIAHGAGAIEARPSLAAYAALFLLPLVSGALSQLLPVWKRPGSDSPARRKLRDRLATGGRIRLLLFCLGGVPLAFGLAWGALFAAAALASFAFALAVALWLDREKPSDDNPGPRSKDTPRR
jgi:hypothetical protein